MRPFRIRQSVQAKKILKVESLELGDLITVMNLSSLERMQELQAPEETIVETNRDYFLLQKNVAFKVLKKDALPEIITTRDLSINPDFTKAKATLEAKDLLTFALKNNIPVFETPEEYVIPSEITLTARKEKVKVPQGCPRGSLHHTVSTAHSE
jgi:hypothetical protein